MRMELATEPGSPQLVNEDYVALSAPASGLGGSLVVLDGVTPPPGFDGCVHGVPWYVARLGGALIELSASRRELPLAHCLAQAISRTAEAHRGSCDLSHSRTPQATVVLARWGNPVHVGGGKVAAPDSRVEYLVLSDSVLLLEHRDGRVDAVRETDLDRVRLQASGLPPTQRAARIESLRNVEGGFHTAAADPSVVAHAVAGSVPHARLRSLAALTDGASRWTEVFARGSWQALHSALRDEGPAALIEQVREDERADPHGARHPRGKAHDDATAAYISW